MAKKISFMLLVFLLVAAGAVVSMATEDDAAIIEGLSDEQAVPTYAETDLEEPDKEEYSHETVLEEYRSVLNDEDSQSESILVKDINVQPNGAGEIQDYTLSATMADDVTLNDDFIILMVFIKRDDSFELLGAKEGRASFLPVHKFTLPNIGEENPNHVRVAAFLKSAYKELVLGENLQITNMNVIIQAQKFQRESLLDCSEVLNTLKKLWNVK